MHKLRQVLHHAVHAVHAEVLAIAIERHQDGFHVGFIDRLESGRADVLNRNEYVHLFSPQIVMIAVFVKHQKTSGAG
ncbi:MULTISPECIES: hypothetical protein [Rhizobium]|uniref:hypothetical protein n=1 Tax=Rhizobium TaxID=379 RepID=UPI0006853D89|nr:MULTISPECIES: hypothetical protein [Rhizobium]MCS0463539.1 hypothetical protein [Rhizobium favelukesii]UFS84188.1 hypothetical protein LPB79_18745 [Rhizobium sp. T136]